MLPGTQVVRIGWDPPDDNAEADLIVIERSVNANGPWEEIAAKLPATGFHEATATFRHGNFYYFRAFMTRGNEETEPAEPISVWIPDVGALERTAPGVVVPANSTPTPVPGSDVPHPRHSQHRPGISQRPSWLFRPRPCPSRPRRRRRIRLAHPHQHQRASSALSPLTLDDARGQFLESEHLSRPVFRMSVSAAGGV